MHLLPRIATTVVAVAAAALTVVAATPAQALAPAPLPTSTPPTPAAWHDPLTAALQGTVTAMATQRGATDGQYLAGGVWHSGDESCWRCSEGPAVAAATLAADTGDATDLSWANQTYARAVTANVLPTGGFGPFPASEGGPAIQTALFVPQLGVATLLLGDKVSPVWRDRFVGAARQGADYLISNGNVRYYTNGNIALANALSMAVTYEVTGDPTYQTAYQQALAFAVAPPQDAWAGDGLVLTTVPTLPDWSDGAGYFAERGVGGLGYDPDYTQVQSDLLARLYLVTRDPRVKQLMNVVVNQLLPRVDTRTAQLDISGGTRLNAPGQSRGFYTGALATLVWLCGRGDLRELLTTQLAAQTREFTAAGTSATAGTYYLTGQQPATVLQALAVWRHADLLAPQHGLATPALPTTTLRSTSR